MVVITKDLLKKLVKKLIELSMQPKRRSKKLQNDEWIRIDTILVLDS